MEKTTSFTFVCATPMPENGTTRPKFLDTIDSIASFQKDVVIKKDILWENFSGLSSVYNMAISRCDTDYIVFIHDDVIINDIYFFKKILDERGRFDVMGVAGAIEYTVDNINMRQTWTSVSRPENRRGFVTHVHKRDEHCSGDLLNASSYGFAPAASLTIDGLLMVANVGVLKEKNVKFDESFTFDFYDMDFSMACCKAKVRVGIIPVMLTHYSGGEGCLSEKYLDAQRIFMCKYMPKMLAEAERRRLMEKESAEKNAANKAANKNILKIPPLTSEAKN